MIKIDDIEISEDEEIKYIGTNDAVFKQVLRNKNICAEVINLITNKQISPEELDISTKEIGVSATAKSIVCDLVVVTKKDIFDLEMQNRKEPSGLLDRFTTYAAKLLATSDTKGQAYNESPNVTIIVFYGEKVSFKDPIYLFPKEIEYKKDLGNTKFQIFIILLANIKNCSNIKLRSFIDILTSKKPQTIIGEDNIMEEVKKEIFKVNKSQMEAYVKARNEAKELYDRIDERLRKEEEDRLKARIDEMNKVVENQQKTLDTQQKALDARTKLLVKALLDKGMNMDEIKSIVDLSDEEIKKILI